MPKTKNPRDIRVPELYIGFHEFRGTPIDLGEFEMQVYIWQWTADYLVELFVGARLVPMGSSWPHNIRGTPYAILKEIRRLTSELLRDNCYSNFVLGRPYHVPQ
ncbi:hypothetical protein PspLS_09829 [Pyricularia sp. CBS 133598]|nr:hypothetical protein PspLS_09829 [Pyricularia sp. CBS 133598]